MFLFSFRSPDIQSASIVFSESESIDKNKNFIPPQVIFFLV